MKNGLTLGQRMSLMSQKHKDREISLSHCGSSSPKKQAQLAFFHRFEINVMELGVLEHSLITFFQS